jgi:glycosyltransferase involved in cell wall biosynthesis
VKAKNILFIIPEMSMGGAQRSLSKLSKALSTYHKTWIVVFNLSHAVATTHNEEIISLDVFSGTNPILKIIAFFKRIIALRKLKRKLRIDVAISFLEGADYVNILSRQQEKVVLSIRGSKRFDENMIGQNFALRKKIIRLLYRRANAIACVNKGIRKEIVKFYGVTSVPVHVVHNFYDTEEIHRMANLPLPSELLPLFDNPVIAMSGRLAIEKGHDFVISTFAQLKKSKPSVTLLLIGDGPLREKLAEQCVSLRLSVGYKSFSGAAPDVFITGEQANVFKFLNRSTLYLLNSSSEGFPNGLVEAMASGVPVLSADCPYGPREILDPDSVGGRIQDAEFGEYGVLLPMPDQSSLHQTRSVWLDAMAQLLTSAPLREKYRISGAKRVAQFSREEILGQWIKVIEE